MADELTGDLRKEFERLADAFAAEAEAQGPLEIYGMARHELRRFCQRLRAAPPPEPSDAEIEAVARPIYDELEGPINNQSFDRQMKQWERAKVVARAAIAALRAKGGAR